MKYYINNIISNLEKTYNKLDLKLIKEITKSHKLQLKIFKKEIYGKN